MKKIITKAAKKIEKLDIGKFVEDREGEDEVSKWARMVSKIKNTNVSSSCHGSSCHDSSSSSSSCHSSSSGPC